jgi:hypothetical protein
MGRPHTESLRLHMRWLAGDLRDSFTDEFGRCRVCGRYTLNRWETHGEKAHIGKDVEPQSVDALASILAINPGDTERLACAFFGGFCNPAVLGCT